MREFVDRGDDDIREGNDNTVENFEAKMNGGDIICKGFNDDRKDNCPHCGKIFWSRMIMENHIQFHGLSCLVCGQAFKHEGNWPDQVLHIKRHNRTAQFELSDKKTYNCLICAKSFRGPSALKHHFKIHIDVRAFSCNL